MATLDGTKLQRIRKLMHKTQAEMAEAADTSERYTRDLEKGRKRDPSARIVHGCASFLGVSMEELMTTQKEEP